MSKGKVFVTGADGMLGSSICRELLKQDYELKALCLPGRTPHCIHHLPIEIVFGDVLNRDFLLEVMQDCQYVIHVASLTDVWPRRKLKIKEVNIQGTENVYAAAEQLKLKRMVSIGSASSFDPGTIDVPSNETAPYHGWKFGMDYIDSKFLAQEFLLKKYAESGFPVLLVCPTYMIGPFDSAPSSGQMLIALWKGKVPGYSGGGKNFVCSVDVANAAVNALQLGRPGECYIAGHQNLSYEAFFKKACAQMEKPFTLRKIPQSLILLVGAVQSIFARIRKSKPALSYGMAKVAAVGQYYDASKAVNELKMSQTPIEKGIRDCMDWFSENGYLK